ncbi:MAG: hypothetical protein HOK04_13370 [Verrucomicrobia bacterium]|jgi:hypothetical protein|nr:hypothetical protein [Verrucomicrobiota bacterium]
MSPNLVGGSDLTHDYCGILGGSVWAQGGRNPGVSEEQGSKISIFGALIDRYFDRLLDQRFLSRKGPFFGFVSSAAFWIRPLSRMVPVRWLPLIELTVDRQTKDVVSDGL